MKARIRKTGEIVEVITYSGSTIRNEYIDKVSYIDSKGVEHDRETLNYYWDFEQLPDVKEENFPNTDWNQVRIQAAIAAMQGLCSNPHPQMVDTELKTIAGWASVVGKYLIEELKKEQE